MANLNSTEFFNKVYGCWVGKNIGGTLGTPFEGKTDILDIRDFHSPSGKPLANDDLDLQLVWLKALEEYGPNRISEKVLGEYWLDYIPAWWNEYGIGKSNMQAGLLPPVSGDYKNPWRDSNGAWIRSEIWASITPGDPEAAAEFAWYDACVDHGTGEGTYAEYFTSSIESAAYVISDREELLKIGLSYIPENCRVAQSVRVAMDAYKDGADWKTARQRVVEDAQDLGWFQAPANVAFFVIGWLYGEGDFKKSLLIAVNCGDDTDCTGATLGSILGILGGVDSIPGDWRQFIGDDIISVALNRASGSFPTSCRELTERVVRMAKITLAMKNSEITISGDETDLSSIKAQDLVATENYWEKMRTHDGSVFYDFVHTRAYVKYMTGAGIGQDGEAELKITLENKMPGQRHYSIRYILPDGLTLEEGPKSMVLQTDTRYTRRFGRFTVKLRANEYLAPQNRIIIEISSLDRPTDIILPILLLAE